MFDAAPTLETERLRLRAYRREDFPSLVALWGDSRVMRHVLGRASTDEETWARLLRYAGLWPLLGYGYWAVEERGTGRFVGDVGFADFRREMTPSFGDAPEAGWVLAAWAHGQGFATEAVRAAHEWSDAHLVSTAHGAHGERHTVCMVAPENTASIRVAMKCGYVPNGHATYKGSEAALFRRGITPASSEAPARAPSSRAGDPPTPAASHRPAGGSDEGDTTDDRSA
jgi:RimJ/RimL family protein N-acetyltransferase